MSVAAGQRLLHYRLIERIGKGGMGEVFVAEDTKLKRKVALKILPPELAEDPERRARFEREALAVAALNHPNIITIHAVEHAERVHFFTMELVDGKPLTQRIPKDGVPLHELFEIAIPLADALAAAHGRGITHRDLKPDNVMLTADGRVKVLDFGLAKVAAGSEAAGGRQQDATATVTQQGRILGTVNYMSPEQAEGKSVDARSDVFSLGVLLYQMATGQVPFQGDTPISTITSIMRDMPTALTDLNQGLPRHLDRVVKRCLAKDPGRRYQSALELRNELEHLKEEVDSGAHDSVVSSVNALGSVSSMSGTSFAPAAAAGRSSKMKWIAIGAAALVVVSAAIAGSIWLTSRLDGGSAAAVASAAAKSGKKMIAVLPFENLGSADDEYFAAGVTEEITSRLAGTAGLGVISRKSAVQYAGSDKNFQQIGRELGVDYVLEGSVRWARGGEGTSRVRITPQLIDVAADTNVWSEVFDREIDDVFEIQSEIARQVVNQLGVAVLGPTDSVEERPTENIDAYHAYLRGKYYQDSPAPTGSVIARATEFYKQAVELDPNFALAWCQLVQAHAFLYHLGFDVSEERRRAARSALDRAERLAPELGELHLARGYYYYWGFKDYEPALEEFRLAAQKMADSTDARSGEAFVLRRLRRWDETIRIIEELVEVNPRDAHLRWDLAETLVYDRRYSESVAVADESLALQPSDNVSGYVKAAALWAWKGRAGLPDARAAIDASSFDPTDDFTRYHGFWQRVFEGQPAQALEYLRKTPDEEWVRQPEETSPTRLFEAWAFELMELSDEAAAAYRDAVKLIEAELERTPEDYRLFGALGVAYAGLGRREDALDAARHGVEMLPLATDALIAPARVFELALVHAKSGEAEAAVEQLDKLLDFTGKYSIPLLEMDPRFDVIRDHPDYRQLVEKYG
jgi:serine/threonine protein kinase/TolB-like protein/tetratricopeptide (TPR) repeat protein